MKSTRNALLTSGLCLVLTVLMLMGSTFAWFTDTVVNEGNTIETGKLDIRATGYRWDSSTNSWTVLHNLRETLISESNWEPGVSNVAVVRASNLNSTLAAKVKMQISLVDNQSSLADAIWVHITPVVTQAANIGSVVKTEDLQYAGKTILMGDSNVTPMSHVEEITDPEVTLGHKEEYNNNLYVYYIIEYGMYADAGNQFQNGSIEMDIGVVATQAPVEADGFGNTGYDNDAQWPDVQVGDTTQELVAALEAAKPGDVLQLAPVTYALTSTLEIPNGVTLLGANAGVPASEWYTAGAEGATRIVAASGADRVIKIEQGEGESINNVVLDGILVDGNNENTKGIFVKKTAGNAMTGIVIRNCAVVNCGNDGIDVNNTNGAVIENNYVDGVYDNGIQLNGYKNAQGVTAYIRNNVVKNVGSAEKGGTINGAIAVSGGQGDVVVSGNVLENIRSGHQVAAPKVDMGESAIVVESVYEGGVITIENNTLSNVEQGIAVYKFSAPTSADKVVIRNNSITNGETFCIATSTLNYKKLSGVSAVEVTDNTFSDGTEPVKGGLYVEQVNRYNETTTGWQVTATGNTSGNGTYTQDTN